MMKRLLITMAILAMGSHAFSEDYEIQISPRDFFNVSTPPHWTLKQKKYNENQDAEFMVLSKDNRFVLKMFFLRINEKYDSKQKVKDQLVFDGKEFLDGAIENDVEIKEMGLKKGYGFYAVFTDKETASNTNPKPTDYQYMTRGYISLSDDSLLGFWVLTHKTDDATFKELTKYLTGYIK